jgi:DNA-binding response OmpR family regulator
MILPKNIIIVEDEIITQRYLSDILQQYDINIAGCFDNAEETMDALDDNIECDMLLMDINIKGATDGIQLAKKILKIHNFPIIFITAHSDENTFEEVLELAPYGFIGKPFSSKDIIYTIQLAHQRYIENEKNRRQESSERGRREYLFLSKEYSYSRPLKALYKNEQAVKLNKKQNKLLEILVHNVNNTVHYDELINNIWEDDMVADSALRTLVYSIRKIHPDLPIVSHSKVGYSIEINRNK